MKDTEIVFICQPGELEIKSLLLAFSLRQYHQNIAHVFIPERLLRGINKQSIRLFGNLRIEVKCFSNPYLGSLKRMLPGDPMSNKFYALQQLETNRAVLFLDSDTLLLKELPDFTGKPDLAMKPADAAPGVNWQGLFAQRGLVLPAERVFTTITLESVVPYYNSGVLWIRPGLHQALTRQWEEEFVFLSQASQLKNKLFDVFHRDQLALSLVLAKRPYQVQALGEEMNFPVRRRARLDDAARIAHYHDLQTLRSNPTLNTLFYKFYNESDDFRQVVKSQRPWRYFGKKQYGHLQIYLEIQRLASALKKRFLS